MFRSLSFYWTPTGLWSADKTVVSRLAKGTLPEEHLSYNIDKHSLNTQVTWCLSYCHKWWCHEGVPRMKKVTGHVCCFVCHGQWKKMSRRRRSLRTWYVRHLTDMWITFQRSGVLVFSNKEKQTSISSAQRNRLGYVCDIGLSLCTFSLSPCCTTPVELLCSEP